MVIFFPSPLGAEALPRPTSIVLRNSSPTPIQCHLQPWHGLDGWDHVAGVTAAHTERFVELFNDTVRSRVQ
jgi:hypothetical protein